MSGPVVLAIETSCDETGIAVVEDGRRILANVVASQVELHAPTGGIVPEVAARAHLRWIVPVLDAALADAGVRVADVDAIAVTNGPGLIGSLLVGVNLAKGLAWAHDRPLVGVNHLEGHVRAAWLTEDGADEPPPELPAIVLVVSGGHTFIVEMRDELEYRLLGTTQDDAAGEAFDKAAKRMGLGYPGGVEIDRLARTGDPERIPFPRAWLSPDSADFSFSGLKTSLRNFLSSPAGERARPEEVAASFQEAVVEVLVGKTLASAKREGIPRVVLAGGVSANSRLRSRILEEGNRDGVQVFLPSRALCTDNAAMVAFLGERRLSSGVRSGPELNAYAASRFLR